MSMVSCIESMRRSRLAEPKRLSATWVTGLRRTGSGTVRMDNTLTCIRLPNAVRVARAVCSDCSGLLRSSNRWPNRLQWERCRVDSLLILPQLTQGPEFLTVLCQYLWLTFVVGDFCLADSNPKQHGVIPIIPWFPGASLCIN